MAYQAVQQSGFQCLTERGSRLIFHYSPPCLKVPPDELLGPPSALIRLMKDLPLRGQASLQRFVKGLNHMLPGKAAVGHISDGSRRGGHRQPFPACDLIFRNLMSVKLNVLTAPGGCPGNNHMDLIRQIIRKLVHTERAVMGDHRIRTRPEPGRKQILVESKRIEQRIANERSERDALPDDFSHILNRALRVTVQINIPFSSPPGDLLDSKY